MLLVIVTIVAVVGIIAWYSLAAPDEPGAVTRSKSALDNISHWLASILGPNWPYVLGAFVILLIIILIMTMNIKLNISNSLGKVAALATVASALFITTDWRKTFYNDANIPKTTSMYIEMGIIATLLVANLAVIFLYNPVKTTQ